MIELRGVSKTYQMGGEPVRALRGVSLTIQAGEFLAIMGPSGSGKSTLMNVLGLLDVPDEGSFRLLGREVAGLGEDDLAELRRRSIGFIFQQFNLLARTTALENVSLPLLYSGVNGHKPDPAGLLRRVGLGDRMGHRPNELSGGQQQRVAIARSLVNDPVLLLADEPTGNLDSASEGEIMGILRELNAKGITVVLVTHEEEIARHARRVIRMRDGLVQSDVTSSASPLPAPPPPSLPAPAGTVWRDAVREASALFRQAARSLSANKARTALSMLGILIGVAAVIAMLALGNGARAAIEKQLSSMGSNLLVLRQGRSRSRGVALEAGSVSRLTPPDAVAIAGLPSVRRTAPSVNGRAQVVYGNKNWNTQVLGTTPEYAPMRAALPPVGRFFTAEEDRRRARVAVLGLTPVRELFGGRNPVGEFVKINRVNFQVIGVMAEKGATSWRDQDDVVAVPVNTAMRRLLGKTDVDSIDIEVKDASAMEAAQEEVLDLVARRYRLTPAQMEAFEVRNMAEIQAAMTETSRTMSWLLASIAAISLLVGGIGIMNIMLVSVTERTREIGLRKSVGARRRDILLQFLIEAVVVSAGGGLAGIALGFAVTLAMSHLAGWAAEVSFSSVALAFFFSAGVGVLFGLWPARRASRLNPIEALRYE